MGKREIAAVLILAGAMACNNRGVTPSSTDPFADRARDLVENLAEGRFAAVVSDFDATMERGLTVDALRNNWRMYEEIVGAYESHGEPERVMKGELVVERVPIATSRGTGEVRVTYRPDGTIAGLYFLKADAPPP